jgi:uncharacterized MAPEG superfamily protein
MPVTPALLCVPCLLRLLPALQVHIFSRNCEDRTEAYPDVTQQMLEATQGECALGAAWVWRNRVEAGTAYAACADVAQQMLEATQGECSAAVLWLQCCCAVASC